VDVNEFLFDVNNYFLRQCLLLERGGGVIEIGIEQLISMYSSDNITWRKRW